MDTPRRRGESDAPNEDFGAFCMRHGISLDPQQARAAQAVDGATLLLAIPGSGKTTTMVARVGYLVLGLGVEAGRVVCLTYNRASRQDMERRAERLFGTYGQALKRCFRTINSVSKEIWEDWLRGTGQRPRKLVGDQKEKKAILREAYLEVYGKEDWPTETDLIELDNLVGYAKNHCIKEGDLEDLLEEMDEDDADCFDAYQDILDKRNLMDFDDQLVFAYKALKANGELRDRWQRRYDYWCVDEAQDVSRIQHAIIWLLARERNNVFMVGDEDQSIYGFRGAVPEKLLAFPYRDKTVLKLETNYRSTTEIVDAARGFVAANTGREDKDMRDVRGSSPGSVETVDANDLPDLYRKVSDVARQCSERGTVGVLFRENDNAIPLMDLMLREGMPFTMLSGRRTFFSNRVVDDVRAFMTLSLDPHDEAAFRRVYRKLGECYLRRADCDWACKRAKGGTTPLDALVEQAKSYRRRSAVSRDSAYARRLRKTVLGLADMCAAAAIATIRKDGYDEYLELNYMSSNRLDLLEAIAQREASIGSFLGRLRVLEKEMERATREKGTDVPDGIVLSSVHSSKGLEFDTVIIADAVDGTFPSSREPFLLDPVGAADPVQEERRIFYVAITRARDHLVLMRRLDVPTPFVDELFKRAT